MFYSQIIGVVAFIAFAVAAVVSLHVRSLAVPFHRHHTGDGDGTSEDTP